MTRIPFDKAAEMSAPVREIPQMGLMIARKVWNTPITPRENMLAALSRGEWMFLPLAHDANNFQSRIIPDNKARGFVLDGLEPFTPSPAGEIDAFGINWLFQPEIGGAMEDPAHPPVMDDANDWEKLVNFPDVESWDWEGAAKAGAETLADPLFFRRATIYSGFFERLISFMGFEDASVALIDEDQQDAVHALFDKLAETYISYVDHMHRYFDIEVVEVHDDWGNQKSTMFSEDTLDEMIIPHMKKVVDAVHERGMFFELHSCGKIDNFVPYMINMEVDTWQGQPLNDKKALFDQYGDKIVLGVECPAMGEDATDDEIYEAAERFADDFIVAEKPVVLGINSSLLDIVANRPLMFDALYEVSRKRLCG